MICVCMSSELGKTAESIDMPFKNALVQVLDWVLSDPHQKGTVEGDVRGKARILHLEGVEPRSWRVQEREPI